MNIYESTLRLETVVKGRELSQINLPMAKNDEQRTTMVTARNILIPFSSVTFTVNSLNIQLSN